MNGVSLGELEVRGNCQNLQGVGAVEGRWGFLGPLECPPERNPVPVIV